MALYFEDFEVGATRLVGSRIVSREEILEFSRKYVRNQEGEDVMTMIANSFFLRREAAE